MTINHADLFPLGYPLIVRFIFTEPGIYNITAPAAPTGANYVRAAVGGAGGFKDDVDGWGGGAAYAFAQEACAPGAAFSCQVGDTQHTRPAANDVLGDSWVKRGDTSILTYADRGRPDGTGGLVANCTGSVKRAGFAATSSQGGASAGDDVDPYPLGFGGRGASITVAPWYGGGGGHFTSSSYPFSTFPAGDGRVVVEFYLVNPGY